LDDLKDSAGNRHLVVQGAITVDVPLEGADRAALLARGGDGKAARFEGGYLVIKIVALRAPARRIWREW
jgi:hypothetical protein